MKVIKKIPVFPGPSGLTISNDENFLFISHTEVKFNPESNSTEGIVSVIDTSSLTLNKEIPSVGKASSDIKALTPLTFVVAANFRGQSLSYIDQDGFSHLGNVDLQQGSPIDITYSKELNKIFVANYNHPFIHIVDNETRTLDVVLHSSTFGKESNGILVVNRGKSLCLTNTESNELICIDNIHNLKEE